MIQALYAAGDEVYVEGIAGVSTGRIAQVLGPVAWEGDPGRLVTMYAVRVPERDLPAIVPEHHLTAAYSRLEPIVERALEMPDRVSSTGRWMP